MAQLPQLPAPWQMHMSKSTQKKYYFNPKTNKSTYVFAEVLLAVKETSQAPLDQSVTSGLASAGSPSQIQTTGHASQAAPVGYGMTKIDPATSDRTDAAVVAQSYDRIKAQSKQERQASPIFYLRTFNNWVKAALIVLYGSHETEPSVLDLACGKLGDMSKWREQSVKRYTGIDISRMQLQEAASRFTSTSSRLKQQAADAKHRGKTEMAESLQAQSFQLRLVQADLGVVNAEAAGVFSDEWSSLQAAQPDSREVFGCASMQFALHYLFATEARAVQFFRSLADRLAPGGHFIGTIPDANVLVRRMRDLPPGENTFGNSLYHITVPQESLDRQQALGMHPFGLRYTFFLQDQVENIDEYLVPWPLLVRLARMAGLQPVLASNFHDFYALVQGGKRAGKKAKKAKDLIQSMVSGREAAGRSDMSPEEWEVAGLYMVFAFKKLFPGPATDMPAPPPSAPPVDAAVPPSLRACMGAGAQSEPFAARTVEELTQVAVPSSGREVYSWPPRRQRLHIPYRYAIQANQILDAASECKLAWEAHLLEREVEEAAAARSAPPMLQSAAVHADTASAAADTSAAITPVAGQGVHAGSLGHSTPQQTRGPTAATAPASTPPDAARNMGSAALASGTAATESQLYTQSSSSDTPTVQGGEGVATLPAAPAVKQAPLGDADEEDDEEGAYAYAAAAPDAEDEEDFAL
jgi:mRNA (guanine-N7-)-methyltransferase